jgi:hypothetical protein
VASGVAVVAENNYTAAPGPVTVEGSRLSGGNTLFLGRDAIIQVAGSRLQGAAPPRTMFRTLTCYSSYDASYAPVSSECNMGP